LFTASDSADRSALPEEDAEPPDDPEAAGAELAGEEPELELLDEQAASMSAAAVIASADAMRLARGMRDAPRAPPPRLEPCL
jgi:hypothetical protein